MPNSGFDNAPSILTNVAGNAAGIISTRPNAKYMSGARCTLKINNKLVGFAFAISWNINTTMTEINTIDDYLPYEYAPQRLTVDGTISALHIPGESPNTDFWQGNVLTFLFTKYVSIEARDSATNQVIFATDKAVIVSRSEEIRIDQLSNVTLRWRAIGYLDEQAPKITDQAAGYNASSTTAPSTVTRNTNPVSNAIASVTKTFGL
jgi:hypothetical protein